MHVSFREVGPAIDEAELAAVEKRLSIVLPDQYKDFIRRTNGGRPKPADFRITWAGQSWAAGWAESFIHFFLSVSADDDSEFIDYYDTFKGRIPADTLVIAYDEGGNQILIGIGSHNYGQIFFWVHDYEQDEPDYSNVGFIANTFNEFMDSLFNDE